MIKKLIAQNVLSFRDRIQVEFSDIAVILGKNASGKTNLLFLIKLICDIAVRNFVNSRSIGLSNIEYKFKEEHEDILLALSFDTCGYEYEIVFVLKANEGIVSQSLKYIKHLTKSIKKQILFSTDSNTFPFLSKIELERLETYKWCQTSLINVLSNEFDLSDDHFKEHINRVFEYLYNKVNNYSSWERYNMSAVGKRLFDNIELTKKIVSALNNLDIPITNILVDRNILPIHAVPEGMEELARDREDEYFIVRLEHLGKYPLPNTFESAGTIKLLKIFSILLDDNNNGEVWLFDELENSLHEEIYKIIPLLIESKLKGQIIFTSHNTLLLDSNMLQKKQVLIVNKSDSENSEVFSLSDFPELRSDLRNNWQRWYRQNRFGGYPEIVFDQIADGKASQDNCDG